MPEASVHTADGDTRHEYSVNEFHSTLSLSPSVWLYDKTLTQQYRIEKPLGGGRRAYELGIDSPDGARP